MPVPTRVLTSKKLIAKTARLSKKSVILLIEAKVKRIMNLRLQDCANFSSPLSSNSRKLSCKVTQKFVVYAASPFQLISILCY